MYNGKHHHTGEENFHVTWNPMARGSVKTRKIPRSRFCRILSPIIADFLSDRPGYELTSELAVLWGLSERESTQNNPDAAAEEREVE